jgi:hypothetical protein
MAFWNMRRGTTQFSCWSGCDIPPYKPIMVGSRGEKKPHVALREWGCDRV